MPKLIKTIRARHEEAQLRRLRPHSFIEQDYEEIYTKGRLDVGSKFHNHLYPRVARKNTVCIVGAQLGDEGKGRFVDNKLQELLSKRGVKKAYVIRYAGGSNAGHTIYTEKGVKIPLHQIPSSILVPQAIGLMDSGMVIHPEDLMTEIIDAEKIVGDLRERLVLSDEALLVTDLERAEEIVNRFRSSGKSEGGTGRGISPTYANQYSRLGLLIRDFFAKEWDKKIGDRYDRYTREFQASGFKLAEMDVPDLRATRDNSKAQYRTVGTKKQFLERLAVVREWYINRDEGLESSKQLVQNTYLIHQQIYPDATVGVLFEGAQAVGLHPQLGRYPDVTSSDTTARGILPGTKFWTPEDVNEKIGIFKITYMSSVGSGKMPTHIDLPRQYVENTKGFDEVQMYGLWVREVAHERGTTTGRYRDICLLDLELMRYNIHVGGIDRLAGTHLDIAREDKSIRVCTHYTDKNGDHTPYQPGLIHQQGVKPHYIELPGWNGEIVNKAKSFRELPLNTQKFLAFVQRQTATPVVAVTTGPERRHLVEV